MKTKPSQGLGESGGELGSPFTMAGKIPGDDGVLQEGFEDFGDVHSGSIVCPPGHSIPTHRTTEWLD